MVAPRYDIRKVERVVKRGQIRKPRTGERINRRKAKLKAKRRRQRARAQG
jgi:hypothetical protein